MKNVASARDLLDRVRLREVQFYEIHARLNAGFADGGDDTGAATEGPQKWDLQLQLRETDLGVRCRLDVGAPDANYVVDAAIFYDFDESLKIEPAALAEFVNRAAFFALYPFVREALHSAGRKIGAQAPLLGMLDPAENRVEFIFDGTGEQN
ncbi:hypothetical protein [Saccharopolyspora sp. ASAGF58]|uniref:hypothetical protein n=1 Tax=Saccharopolyspora sp. ASAGF58 TaxID=2719023 RepID=UPI00143FFD11|nr:hypothetical protein [Saccharopolyspora sp. ASAGF58]QIZ35033.1 hypothetical protein FDZ84_10220 [Saccharopolyspora sp. ASAGF58]